MGPEWFRSFDAIPAVSWQRLVAINPSCLLGFDASASVEMVPSFTDDRPPFERVEWLDPAGEAIPNESGSHAVLHSRSHLRDSHRDVEPAAIAKAVSEMLALPGTRSDYYGMMAAWNALNSSRARDHRVFRWIATLCLGRHRSDGAGT